MDVATLRKILAGETYGENIALCEMEQVIAEYDALRAENERLRAIIVNAQDVIEEVQLIDNTPDEARRVRREMRAALDAAGDA